MNMTTSQASPGASSTEAASPAALQRMSAAMLDGLWAALPPPAAGELRGDYPGRVLTGAGFESLPRWLAALARRAAAWLWRAKSFAGDRGINLWWSPFGRLRRVPYRVAIEAGAIGTGQALVLDYDLAVNPRPARRVRGELRRLAPGFYLGRMLLRGRTGFRLVTYFTLQHPETAGS